MHGPVLEAFSFGGRRLKELFVEQFIFPKLLKSLNTRVVWTYRMVIISLLGSYGAFALGEVECLGREFGFRRQDQVVRGGGIILPRIFVHHCELIDF